MPLEPKWYKAYERLLRKHYDDQNQVVLLQRQLRHFQSKRDRLQNQIEQESKGMDVWMNMMETLRRGVERFQKNKHLLSPQKHKQLRRIIRQIPLNTLEERVRLMEVSEKLMPKPCEEATTAITKEEKPSFKYSVPHQKRCNPKTQASVDKRLSRIQADLQDLCGIHEKTTGVIADIRSLMATINYLDRGQCTNIKIIPYRNMSKDREPAMKATIKLDRLRKTKTKNHYTRELMDIRPQYILDHVPQLKLSIFDIPKSRSKKLH
ncbi:uncharacterized protein LOC108116474 [Drosophila eugracilis]|uniref:uncharacterized protein LOC108116474 n=1 Tax=Drosophila eugracilis TaxID=29029 RepID=UPI0007E873DA|nr:uncharacterized protein LOC108116474 [Drosophila eugracilis]